MYSFKKGVLCSNFTAFLMIPHGKLIDFQEFVSYLQETT